MKSKIFLILESLLVILSLIFLIIIGITTILIIIVIGGIMMILKQSYQLSKTIITWITTIATRKY